jgi:K+ potassium transporter
MKTAVFPWPGMAAKDGDHIIPVGQAAAGNPVAILGPSNTEKGQEADSIYDEEDGIGTKETDFKRKQARHGSCLRSIDADPSQRSSRDGRSCGWPTRQLGSSTVTLGRRFWWKRNFWPVSSTSPLYVYSSTFSSNPSHDDVLGALSLIIWSLTLIVTVKYVCIVLLADDEGEGGTFAMYNLISRFVWHSSLHAMDWQVCQCNISTLDPSTKSRVKLERYLSNDLRPSSRGFRSFLEQSRFIHVLLKVLSVFGVALIIADGVLTPAQSILGAIQGIEVVSSNLTYHQVIGISCGILVLLFAVQPLGITKISGAWAPIVIIWFSFNFAFGVYVLLPTLKDTG